MLWWHYVGFFFGGAFLANALPHLIAGVSGTRLPTPFASPPFKGLSSPPVNLAWALVNLAMAYLTPQSRKPASIVPAASLTRAPPPGGETGFGVCTPSSLNTRSPSGEWLVGSWPLG